MGSWNFIIDLKMDEDTLDSLVYKYNSNSLYQTAFCFNRLTNDLDMNFNAGILSVIDNFLPANHLIYEFLSSIDNKNFYIRTNGIKHIFDFNKKSEFINFMYNAWESKLDLTYKKHGVILLNIQNYYRTRNRLYKKYYKKI